MVDNRDLEVPLRLGVGPWAGAWCKRADSDADSDQADQAEAEGDTTGKKGLPAYLGARAVVGADLDLSDLPLQIFVEGGVDVVLTPRQAVRPTAVVGARYYF